jgi:ubiquitin C
MQILVKTLTGKTTAQRTLEVKTITLDVKASDTVLRVKVKIEKMEDIMPNKQHLIFMEESLGNNCAISDYNIQEGAVLHLQIEWGMQILVVTRYNKTLLMDVVPVDTVGFLKAMIQHQEGIPPDQQVMISTAGLLEDDRTLSDYNIKEWDTVHQLRMCPQLASELRGLPRRSSWRP